MDGSSGALPRDLNRHVTCIAFGDVDQDGDVDVAAGTNNGGFNLSQQNWLFRNDGLGGLTPSQLSLPPQSDRTQAVVLRDLDGDGDVDLVFGNLSAPDRLLRNDGRGGFTDATSGGLPVWSGGTRGIAAVDVDRDSDLDLILANDNTAGRPQDTLLLNQGNLVFADVTAARMPVDALPTLAVVGGDVDRDGWPDLILGHDRMQTALYLNDQRGGFTDATVTRMPTDADSTRALVLADLDGDADLDLVLANAGSQSLLYLNDGRGFFTDATATRMPVHIFGLPGLSAGDVDEDGDLDLVFTDVLGPTKLYVNDGTGLFREALPDSFEADRAFGSAVGLADLDLDRDLDLVLARGRPPSSALLLHADKNLLRQVHAPLLPRAGGTYRLDSYVRPGSASGLLMTLPFWSVGRRTPGILVPGFGTWNLADRFWPLPILAVPTPQGMASLTTAIPGDPALKGVRLFVQALAVDLFSTQWDLTNVLGETIH